MNPTVNPTSTTSVLLIDDDPDIRDALSDMLKHEGYLIHAVGTGREGIDRVQSTHYGAVLLDIGLPDMDGHEVARRLRSSERMRGVKLCALTGYGKLAERSAAFAAGFDEHLTKPVSPERLKRALEELA